MSAQEKIALAILAIELGREGFKDMRPNPKDFARRLYEKYKEQCEKIDLSQEELEEFLTEKMDKAFELVQQYSTAEG